jgi:hypothetical protein
MLRRRGIWVVGLTALGLLIAAGAWLLLPPRTGTVVIEVSGPAGTQFQGSCEVDGNRRDLSGTAPARFAVEAHKLVYSIAPADATGGVSVNVEVAGRASGSVSSGDPPGVGVHGWVQFGGHSPSYWTESFDPKRPERWMVPAP